MPRSLHRSSRSAAEWGAVLVLALAACDSERGIPVCTGLAEPAVVVELRSAVTGDPITGATVVLSEGAYSEVMFEGLQGTYQGGHERPGTYRVEASAAGFVPQTLAGITAAELPCGPDTQTVEIRLQPSTMTVLLIAVGEDGDVSVLRGGFRPNLPVIGPLPTR